MSDLKAGDVSVRDELVDDHQGAHFRPEIEVIRDRWWNSWKALFAITVLGAVLRVIELGRQSYWLDEGASLYYVQQHQGFWEIVDSLANGGDNHPPIHFLTLYGMDQFFDLTNEVAMRAPSVVASLFLIPAAWVLASLVAPRFRAVAALLAAVSPFLIWYAQEARMYAMAEAFAAWSIVAFFKSSQSGSSNRWLALHVACRVLGFYTHVYAILLCVAELLLLPSVARSRRKPILAALAIEFVLMAPWFGVLYMQRGDTAGTDTGSPVIAAAYSLFVFVFGYSFGPGVRALHISIDLSLADMVQLGIAGIVSAGLIYAGLRTRTNKRFQQLFIVIGTPIVLAALVTAMSSVTLNARYLSIVYVPFVCLVALSLGKQWSSKLVRATAFLLACVTVASLVQYWTMDKYEKDDYRSAMEFIDSRNAQGDPIFVLTYPAPALVYANNQEQIVNFAPDSVGARSWRDLRDGSFRVDNAWVLYARSWELDSNGSHLRELRSLGTLSTEAEFPGVQVMRLSTSRS